MPLAVTHPFASAAPDDPQAAAAGQVLPSHWNAAHALAGALDPQHGGVPAGAVFPFAGAAAPPGYLACDGAAVSRTTYADLLAVLTWGTTATAVSGGTQLTVPSNTNMFVGQKVSSPGLTAVATIVSFIGTTKVNVANATANTTGTIALTLWPWGSGDGVATFNVPYLNNGKVPVGTYPSSYPLGAGGGAALHLLTESEMPQHRHSTAVDYYSGGGGSDVLGVTTVYHDAEDWGDNCQSGYAGGNQYHNNMPPYLCLNYVIKT